MRAVIAWGTEPLSFRVARTRGLADDRMEDIVRSIRTAYPDCATTLSIGERSRESLSAGPRKPGQTDICFVTQQQPAQAHYRKLHPEEMSLANRKECLYTLKELGYQVGAGFMVGAPGQTLECLAEKIRIFLHDLQPEMIGIGPFSAASRNAVCP